MYRFGSNGLAFTDVMGMIRTAFLEDYALLKVLI